MNSLHRQIQKYFEAELTPQEEKSLLRELLKIEGQDPAADEALAVMLASRLAPAPSGRRKRLPLGRIAAVAAIAVAVAAGVFFLPRSQDVRTFAYVSGKKIHDTAEIKNLVATQLQDIGESTDYFSQTMTDDLDDIREALTSDDI